MGGREKLAEVTAHYVLRITGNQKVDIEQIVDREWRLRNEHGGAELMRLRQAEQRKCGLADSTTELTRA